MTTPGLGVNTDRLAKCEPAFLSLSRRVEQIRSKLDAKLKGAGECWGGPDDKLGKAFAEKYVDPAKQIGDGLTNMVEVLSSVADGIRTMTKGAVHTEEQATEQAASATRVGVREDGTAPLSPMTARSFETAKIGTPAQEFTGVTATRRASATVDATVEASPMMMATARVDAEPLQPLQRATARLATEPAHPLQETTALTHPLQPMQEVTARTLAEPFQDATARTHPLQPMQEVTARTLAEPFHVATARTLAEPAQEVTARAYTEQAQPVQEMTGRVVAEASHPLLAQTVRVEALPGETVAELAPMTMRTARMAEAQVQYDGVEPLMAARVDVAPSHPLEAGVVAQEQLVPMDRVVARTEDQAVRMRRILEGEG